MSHIKNISIILLLFSSIISFYYLFAYDLHLMNYDFTERGVENYESLITYTLYLIIVLGITFSIIVYYRPEIYNFLLVNKILKLGF